MKPDMTWPERLNVLFGERLRMFRDLRNMTAAQVADRCTELGLQMSRSKIANLENGRARQEGVSDAELRVLAAVLDVPKILLEVPLGSNELVEVLPGIRTDAWTAYRWLVGEVETKELGKPHEQVRWATNYPEAAAVRIYRQHADGLDSYLRSLGEGHEKEREQALGMMAGARVSMNARGWWLPPLPTPVFDAVNLVLQAFGFREEPPGTIVLTPFPGDALTSPATANAESKTDGETPEGKPQ